MDYNQIYFLFFTVMGYKLKRIMMWVNNQEKQVRPSGWTPGSNTLLYIPFTNDYNDYMGNTVTLNHGNAPTYSTTATGESYANISDTTLSTTLSSMDIGNWTVSQRIYNSQNYLDVIWYFGGTSGGGSGYGTGMIISANNELIIFVYLGDVNTGVVVPKNEWHNVVYTQGSGHTKVYLDGVLKYTTNKTYNKSTSIFSMFTNQYNYSANFAGKYDELIVENKTWTAQEISDYYNQTKGNYGL